jgi:hypothetical protein
MCVTPTGSTTPSASWPPVIATVLLYSSLKVMFVPAATACRMARLPEWKNVPSPRFWNRWAVWLNGAAPTHVAPSPPICVMPRLRSVKVVIA